MDNPLTLRKLRAGIRVEWNGSHTFNVYQHDENIDAFTYFDPEGQPPSEMKARALMIDYMERNGE